MHFLPLFILLPFQNIIWKSNEKYVKITLMQNAKIRSKYFMHASMNGDRSFFNNDSDSLKMHFDCFAIYTKLFRNMCICRVEISLLFLRSFRFVSWKQKIFMAVDWKMVKKIHWQFKLAQSIMNWEFNLFFGELKNFYFAILSHKHKKSIRIVQCLNLAYPLIFSMLIACEL